MLSLDAPLKLSAYTGIGDTLFSTWLRNYEDYADLKIWTDMDKARNSKFFLSDLKRKEHEDFDIAVKSTEKWKAFFEPPKMRHVARQSLLSCREGLVNL